MKVSSEFFKKYMEMISKRQTPTTQKIVGVGDCENSLKTLIIDLDKNETIGTIHNGEYELNKKYFIDSLKMVIDKEYRSLSKFWDKKIADEFEKEYSNSLHCFANDLNYAHIENVEKLINLGWC